jgi:predicted CoA-binding protein
VTRVPESVSEFLTGKRFAVAGVSRSGKQPANAIFKKLRDSGYEVVPVNPKAVEIEGVA